MRPIRTALFALALGAAPLSVLAQDAGGGGSTTLLNPLGTGTTLWQLTINVMNFLIQIGAVVIVFMVVYVGFLFVTARGEPAALTTAKKALLWTIIGGVILLGAKAITLGVCATAQAFSTSATITCPTTF
jgi:hypothetical protein